MGIATINTAHLILVKAFNEMLEKYNDRIEGINYIDIRDFQDYIESQNINIEEFNKINFLECKTL